ncbi:hypothetical protein QO179_24710 [Bacillus stercoris]|nr:hypothetical protein [Bacillus stercoris]
MATRDEEIQRQRNTEENGHSLIGTIINAGAVVGLGAAGWRFRREIGSGARAAGEFAGTLTSAGVSKIARSAKFRETMQDMGTFAKAIHEATDSRGVISHLKNPNRFQDRFEQSLQYSLEARARMQRTQLGGEPLKALQEFQDMRYSMKAVQQQTFESIRFSKIEQDIRENMGDFAQKD